MNLCQPVSCHNLHLKWTYHKVHITYVYCKKQNTRSGLGTAHFILSSDSHFQPRNDYMFVWISGLLLKSTASIATPSYKNSSLTLEGVTDRTVTLHKISWYLQTKFFKHKKMHVHAKIKEHLHTHPQKKNWAKYWSWKRLNLTWCVN